MFPDGDPKSKFAKATGEYRIVMRVLDAQWLTRAFRRMTFDNRRFWNRRYITDPTKGSGPGSRGDNRDLKNALIRSAIQNYEVSTVLDIGCGDIAVLSSLDIEDYVGVDIAEVIIERNRRLKPGWRFVCADLTGPYAPPSADLVLCLDVLIHQKSRHNYLTILAKVLAATDKVALVSGYSHRDPGWNVFYHEAIGDSIQRLRRDVHVEKIAEYRTTDLLKITK
jgi:SAM-dependent methyltransferase